MAQAAGIAALLSVSSRSSPRFDHILNATLVCDGRNESKAAVLRPQGRMADLLDHGVVRD